MKQDKSRAAKISPVRIERRPAFTLAGVSAITTNQTEQLGNGKIGSLFERFFAENISEKLGVNICKEGNYSCYFHYEQEDKGAYEVMVSVQVEDASSIQNLEEIQTFTVPEATYAVFETEKGPIVEKVQQAWAAIWEWQQQPENQRTFTGDFEYYSGDMDPANGQVEIYIAVK
ncbi:GyrI-like domain-containing protein [Oceanobacillus sp. J11TS1]|uniref:GyrI-like domain-containing protein n=1 Tax=Oceanobacillus sp. J11TS1 TaxID=2807191 RepID=UPI001B1910E0|nr:GyrI-like domain-containing protein [Oceanobacillus sp. J11TS1]GIO23899.1 putative transcriptional regulator protein YobU [Oceanobacillus sp. J11TS1]